MDLHILLIIVYYFRILFLHFLHFCQHVIQLFFEPIVILLKLGTFRAIRIVNKFLHYFLDFYHLLNYFLDLNWSIDIDCFHLHFS